MPKFAIRLHGSKCLLKVQEKYFGIFPRSKIKCMGFFTTRFIEEFTSQEAERKAIEMVRQEMDTLLLNGPQDPWALSVEEIWEDPNLFDQHGPAAGCTWY